MVTIVVPHRAQGGKRRLALELGLRDAVVAAMLADVLEACLPVGRVVVANGRGSQGAAVAEALAEVQGPALVVNSDVPCVTPDDMRALFAATADVELALVPAADGTTNALALADPSLFEPLYGPGSAARFAALAPARALALPNLVDDVDTLHDLRRLGPRLGRHTRAATMLAA